MLLDYNRLQVNHIMAPTGMFDGTGDLCEGCAVFCCGLEEG